MSTGDAGWDLFLGPLEWVMAETDGDDYGFIVEGIATGCQGE